MINYLDPKITIAAGIFLMLLGFVLPVLMIMQILESTFFLNFLAFGASFLGLTLGFIGVVIYMVRYHKK